MTSSRLSLLSAPGFCCCNKTRLVVLREASLWQLLADNMKKLWCLVPPQLGTRSGRSLFRTGFGGAVIWGRCEELNLCSKPVNHRCLT
jgi:hypothetical protein